MKVDSPRLHLRQPLMSDTDIYFEIFGSPDTNLFNPFGPIPNFAKAKEIVEKIIEHWKKYRFGVWAISTHDNPNEIIGFGGISYYLYGNQERLNLGYRFAKSAWGKGFATELSIFAIEYGFNTLLLHEIFALVRPLHKASIKVLTKSGLILFDKLNDVPNKEDSLVYKISK
jgi:[ribosomal protein S5]-alanine N-acetyltransferase